MVTPQLYSVESLAFHMRVNLLLTHKSFHHKTSTMKLSAAIVLTAVGGAAAFTATPSSIRTSALNMGGFLEGKGKKITVREDEDAAMWFDDGAGGRTPSEKPKKEPVKKEPKKSGGFKFPWDK